MLARYWPEGLLVDAESIDAEPAAKTELTGSG